MLVTLEVDVNLHCNGENEFSLTVHGEERVQQRGFKKSHIKIITENGSEFGQGAFLLSNQDYLEAVSQIKFDIHDLHRTLTSLKKEDNKKIGSSSISDLQNKFLKKKMEDEYSDPGSDIDLEQFEKSITEN